MKEIQKGLEIEDSQLERMETGLSSGLHLGTRGELETELFMQLMLLGDQLTTQLKRYERNKKRII